MSTLSSVGDTRAAAPVAAFAARVSELAAEVDTRGEMHTQFPIGHFLEHWLGKVARALREQTPATLDAEEQALCAELEGLFGTPSPQHA
jgi:hypothetical protein